MAKTREYTNKILELMDEGVLDSEQLAAQLLAWMSEDSAKQFWFANDFEDAFGEGEEEEEDDPMDDFNYVGSPDHY